MIWIVRVTYDVPPPSPSLPGLTEMSPLGRLALRSLSAALASHILSLSAASRSG